MEETVAKKALRAMMMGKIDESVIAFAEANKKTITKIDGPTSVEPKKQYKQPVNEDYNQYETNDEVDFMAEAKKRLAEDRRNGTDSFVNGHKPKTDVSADAIGKLLKGKLNEAREVETPVYNTPSYEKPSYNSNPIEQYSKSKGKQQPTSSFEEIDREILIEDLLKSPDLKALLLELILDNVVSNNRLSKMVSTILSEELKKQLKPALLQTLKEIRNK